MEFSTDYPAVSEGAAVVVEYCDKVTIENNHAKGFDRPLTISRSPDSTNSQINLNDGFVVE